MIWILPISLLLILILQEWRMFFVPFHTVSPVKDLPEVDILLCARNEEDNIKECLQSLINQEYPSFQIWVSNDHSEDDTWQEITSVNSPILNLFDSPVSYKKGVNPKASQLSFLSVQSVAPVIAIADADCLYSPQWLKNMVSGLLNGAFAQVSSATSITNNRWARNEWLSAMGRFSLITPGNSLVGVGHNMVLFREDLQATGGFNATLHSPTEDMCLAELFRKMGRPSLFTLFAPPLVKTKCLSLRESLNQRNRWIKGLKHIPLFYRTGVYVQSALLAYTLPLLCFRPMEGTILYGVYTLSRVIQDIRIFKRVQQKESLPGLLLTELYRQLFSLTFLLFHLIYGSFTWKNRTPFSKKTGQPI